MKQLLIIGRICYKFKTMKFNYFGNIVKHRCFYL